MTITQPNRNKQFAALRNSILFAMFCAGLTAIFLYNQTVNLKHQSKGILSRVESLRVENADLKNRYYSMTDTGRLLLAASKFGLVKESAPEFLSVSQLGKAAVSLR